MQKAVPLVLWWSSQRGKTKTRTLLCCASKQWWESAFPEKAEPHKLHKELQLESSAHLDGSSGDSKSSSYGQHHVHLHSRAKSNLAQQLQLAFQP